MKDPETARERLLDLVGLADAQNQGTTPEQAIDDAIHEAILNQPSLRTCLVPACMRQYDALSCMAGTTPPRPEWSGTGWATLGSGTIFPAGGHICPDHKQLVTDHLPRRVKLPNDRWTVDCACGWMPAPQTWHGLLRALWEQHLLTIMGTLPAPEPIPDPDVSGTRIPLAEHTEETLTELYDRLWDAEADRAETRDAAQAMYKSWDWHRHALAGAARAVVSVCNMMRTAASHYDRDWTADRIDAYLWGVLIGWSDDALEEIAVKHRWDEHRVKYVREMRALLATITNPPTTEDQQQ
ncbi:hypothetical protein [Streptomyces griseorubiginosus]|uniref:hypothetical protein n=1 Tax=Streptomyces griseorubiginosus TaxID=67304 RepID=UPI003316DBC7